VTLEVDTAAAQRLSLASSVGALSLALRKPGEQVVEGARRVTLTDLDSPYTTFHASDAKSLATVTVRRAGQSQDYSVPAEANRGRVARQPQEVRQ